MNCLVHENLCDLTLELLLLKVKRVISYLTQLYGFQVFGDFLESADQYSM